MRWFLDTEFDDNGHTIDLISIALVNEDGLSYSACLADGWSDDRCGDWVKANVLPKLPLPNMRRSRKLVAQDIAYLVGSFPAPEFWAYHADYDWVALCQLYGRMVDLPFGWPKFCFDLVQLMRDRGVAKGDLPKQDETTKHDPLADAEWVRSTWLYLVGFDIWQGLT
jgi:hypothetical protein